MKRTAWILPVALTLAVSSLVAPAPVHAATVTIPVVDYEFEGGPRVVALGTDVRWEFVEGPHTTTSSQGFWNSGQYTAGGLYQRPFLEAGRFAYYCAVHGHHTMNSSIAVRMRTTALTGGKRIHWAVLALPNHNYDVQIKRPGTAKWRTYRSATTATSAEFKPTATGRYLFRARTRNLANDKVSGWSPRKRVRIL